MPSISVSEYPLARKDESIVDDHHGTKVPDPYRWMENPDAPETVEWVKSLNKISEVFLEKAESRELFRENLTKIWDFPKFGVTSHHGDFYYYYHNSGLQNQYVLYQQKTLDEVGKAFLDPNAINPKGTTSVRNTSFSKDGKLFAYGLSENGSDWSTVYFVKADGTKLPDVVKGVNHSGLSWAGDNSGIFYSGYPTHKGEKSGTTAEKQEFHSLYFHRLGTNAEEDVLIFGDDSNPDSMISGSVTEDGRFLIIDISRGCDPYNKLHIYDLQRNGTNFTGRIKPVPLFDAFDAKYDYVDHDDNAFIIMTNLKAPRFKLVKVKMADALTSTGKPPFFEFVPEHPKNKLDGVDIVANDRLILTYIEDCKHVIRLHDLKTGKHESDFDLPVGSVSSFSSKKERNEAFFGFDTHFKPTVVYRLTFENGKPVTNIHREVPLPLDTSKFTVEQVFATSKDGTKVPMYILSPPDLPRDGTAPVLLNGYGGFNVADMPYFSVSRIAALYHFRCRSALANLRGGSEYGEEWHEAGMLHNKQNVFDDFIACAEYLVKEKYTNPEKLGIHGGSNGGLLVGACSQQRPDLYGAVVNRVGVLDMLRFANFTIGAAWKPEFGDVTKKEDFEYIFKYSPLHNIRLTPPQQWPATLLMTADHDDRVVPSHTLKYAATLYEKAKEWPHQQRPLIARIEVNAGHGAGKPTSKVIAELVDIWSFLQRVFDLKWNA